jgi:superfamily II DNA or RNA helicase
MQNFDRFGPVVFEMSEKEAYESGRKVPPRLARLTGLDFEITGPKSMGLLIKKSFEQFNKRWKKHGLCAKVLYDTQGSKEIKWFHDSEEKKELISSGVNVAHADSVNGYWINNKQYNTIGEWRNGLLELPENDPLVVLHIQMLVEGLDVPGFNSLLLTRTRDTSPLKQLIGRIQRLLDIDRDMIGYGQNFKPMNILNEKNAKKLTKPYALVAVLEQRKDVYSFLTEVVNLMRKEYGIDHDKISDYSEWKGTGEDGEEGSGDQRNKKEKQKAREKFLKDQYDAKLVEETNTEMYGNMSAVAKALHLVKLNIDWMKK